MPCATFHSTHVSSETPSLLKLLQIKYISVSEISKKLALVKVKFPTG